MIKKNIGKIFLSLLCITTVLAAGLSFRSEAEPQQPRSDSILIRGTVNSVSDGRLSITRQDGELSGQELIITVSEETKVLDAVTGFPAALSELKSGETVYAYTGLAMTMSLPPMVNGQMILCGIPADYKVPEYITVEKLTADSSGTSGSIKTTEGTTYTINAETQILPHLTRNIVTIQDLTAGKKCLVWSRSGDLTATRITVFADAGGSTANGPDGSSDGAVTRYGWSEQTDGWYFYDTSGDLHRGWLSDNGSWYYLDPETGVMQTGFVTVDGKTYYLLEDGTMLTGPKTFTPDENGALH